MTPLIAPRTDFKVLASSDDWLVVDKPAPLIVHPTNDRPERTLLGEMQARWPGEEFFIINRLDRETSGCVLIARTRESAGALGKMMMRREIQKSYRAIVDGWPEWKEKEVDAPLRRKGEVEDSRIWVRQMVHQEGKKSTTKFVIEEIFSRLGEKFSVLNCEPVTGRTHQIRVHLEHLGHPIVGDKIYGGDGSSYLEFVENGWSPALEKKLLLDRQALHGSGMSFTWKNEVVEVSSGWPRELADFRVGE
ncbi:RluA family pseudouridine synthase [Akkermansiaceae bacterium]|nr:RluA family pseudouridine synthase [Akkermansiaceae bacterium]